ncbi:heavy metal-associated isoprenylated plant protein 32-like isoform X1 [Salvia hispanica]|uniref:heavy metal-associated isoprenylated plant protein 32-like isoform X1 n=1 Tax=Salvia hispanica TaxID=49212 RepID=UPI0020094DEB|nr:heavy metal-associated isoprenylated plant protein 32-like isoform X1 [Salvia hispanica]
MSKQDMLKVQTCVLRVNIHCEGCMHKVKKKLQKVDGVYKVSIDAEQGKVMVSGNADPASLIEKLEKSGKHAELWGPQKGGGAMPFQISQEQLKKFQLENFNKNNQKKGNDHHHHNQMKNGFVELPFKKGGGEKAPAKEQKAVRFELPEDEDDFDDDDDYDDDDYSDDFDEDEDDFEDEFEDVKHSKPLKGGEKPGKGDKLDKGGGGKEGKKAKKGGGGGGIDMFFKGMLSKAAGGKKGKSEKSGKKGESKKEDGGKKGGGGFELGDGKKGKKDDDGWGKKGGENFHGGKQQQHGFGEMKANHKGGGGGGGGGRNMEMMGGFPAVAGMPAINGSRFPGTGQGNPYSQQQQYMAQMMMMNQMNQQREHGHEAAYHPMAYARPPPPAHMGYGSVQPMGYGGPPPMHPMGYGPPQQATGEYAHMFSDENTDSCSIM